MSDSGKVCTDLSVGFIRTAEVRPTTWVDATVVAAEWEGLNDEGGFTLPDLALLKLSRRVDRPSIPVTAQQLALNEEIVALGYPGIGGWTITLVRGVYAGIVEIDGHDALKTDAATSFGNSGGAAFDSRGVFIGVPTGGSTAEGGQGGDLGYLIPAETAERFLERHVGD